MKTSLGPACTTPCTLKFDRRDTFVATFTLGEQTKQVAVETEVAGGGVAATAGNVLAGGVIGVGIDVATGAGLDHTPNPVVVTFEEPAAPAVPAAAQPATPVAETPEAAPVSDGEFNWETDPTS